MQIIFPYWDYFHEILFSTLHRNIFFHLNSYMESMVGSSSWNWWPWWWWISKYALCWSGTCIDTGDPFARHRFRSEPNSPGKYVTAYCFFISFIFSFPFVNAATKALTITLASWLHSHGLSSLLLYYFHFFSFLILYCFCFVSECFVCFIFFLPSFVLSFYVENCCWNSKNQLANLIKHKKTKHR